MAGLWGAFTGKSGATSPRKDEKWRLVLKAASAELHVKLKASPVFVAELLAKGIVDETLQAQINDDNDPQGKLTKILAQLLKGTEAGYLNFCEALETHQQGGALECLKEHERAYGYSHSHIATKSEWSWLVNVYGGSEQYILRKSVLDKVLREYDLRDFSSIADKTRIAQMSLGDDDKIEFWNLRAVCRASRPKTLTIIPWSKPIDVQKEIDLLSCISDVKVVSHSPARTGVSLTVQPFSMDIGNLCRIFNVEPYMVLDLHSKSKPWTEDALVLKYLLQNGKKLQRLKTKILIIESISEVKGKDDYKFKKAKRPLSSTHMVEHVISGIRKCFILHSPKSDAMPDECDDFIECHFHAKTVDRLLSSSIFDDSPGIYGKNEEISMTTREPGKKELSTKNDKWCNIKTMLREPFVNDNKEVLCLDISLLPVPSEEVKPTTEPNIFQEFIQSYQKLEEIERESKLIKPTKIGRHLSDAFNNEVIEKFNQVIKSDNHAMRRYGMVEACVTKYRAEYPEGDIMPGFKEDVSKEIRAKFGNPWFLGGHGSSEKCDPAYYKGKWINVVLLGKPNCGTSSTCNTLIGKNEFETGAGVQRVTMEVEKHEFTLGDMHLRVINTPALYGEEKRSEKEINDNPVAPPAIPHIEKIMELCKGQIHVFLHVQSGDARFTEEEMRVLGSIQETLGKNALKNVAFVITRAEQILGDHHTLRDFMKAAKNEESTRTYKDAVHYAQKRQVMIDNKYESECLKEIQQNNLLQLIRMTVSHSKGNPFESDEYKHLVSNSSEQIVQSGEAIAESYQRIYRHIEDTYGLKEGSFHKDSPVVRGVGGIEKFVYIAALEMDKKLKDITSDKGHCKNKSEIDTMKDIIANPNIILRASEHNDEGKTKGSVEEIRKDVEERLKSYYLEHKHENVISMKTKFSYASEEWVEDISKTHDLLPDVVEIIVDKKKTEAIEFYKGALCFPASSSAQSKSGSILMKDLQIGDEVKMIDTVGNIGYEQIIYFSHKEEKTKVEYMTLTTDAGTCMSIAGSHLLHCNDMGSLKAASEVKVGDVVYTVAEDNVITPQVINVISEQVMDGIYCPHTPSGTIVVDNMLTSCYTTILPQPVMHLLFRSMVFMFGIIPTRAVNWLTTVDDKTGYPPFLETLVNYYAKG